MKKLSKILLGLFVCAFVGKTYADPQTHAFYLKQQEAMQRRASASKISESNFPRRPGNYFEMLQLVSRIAGSPDPIKRASIEFLLEDIRDDEKPFDIETGRDAVILSGLASFVELIDYTRSKGLLSFDLDTQIVNWASDPNTSRGSKEVLLDALLEARVIKSASALYRSLLQQERDEFFGFWLNERFNQVGEEMIQVMRRPKIIKLNNDIPGLLSDYADFLVRIVINRELRERVFRVVGRNWMQQDEGEFNFKFVTSKTYLEFARRELINIMDLEQFRLLDASLQHKMKTALARLYNKSMQYSKISADENTEMYFYSPEVIERFFKRYPELRGIDEEETSHGIRSRISKLLKPIKVFCGGILSQLSKTASNSGATVSTLRH